MKIIVAPDKYKGSLDSFKLCDAIVEGIQMVDKSFEIIKLPMADGGDGFAKVLAHFLKTTTVNCHTMDALGKPLQAAYEWSAKKETAIIELASASGLAILETGNNPMVASTYGTGLLINDAINKGIKKIILGIGGSATNDGGTGLLSALGYNFLDISGEIIKPCGENLIRIEKIIPPLNPIDTEVIIACDVDNTLLGKNGAAYTYAAQKGANAQQIIDLEDGMEHFSKVMEIFANKIIATIPGSGAAGGTGAGLLLLPNVTIKRGVDIVIENSSIKDHLSHADLVITGEGAFDEQTLNGKVVYAITMLATASGVPTIAVCGKIDADYATIRRSGLTYIASIVNGPMTIEYSKQHAYKLVKEKVGVIMHFMNRKRN